MIDLHYPDEAKYQEKQWLSGGIAESAEAAIEILDRKTALNRRAEDTPMCFALDTEPHRDLKGGYAHHARLFERSAFVRVWREGVLPANPKRVFISGAARTPSGFEIAHSEPIELRFSRRTLDLARRGFLLNASSLAEFFENKSETFEISDNDIALFVRERLIGMFGGVADVIAQLGRNRFVMAQDDDFIDVIDQSIQSRIPHVPKEFDSLSRSICSDLTYYLLRGGHLQLTSGKLRMDANRLVLEVTGTRLSRPEPRGRAKLIE